MKKFIPIIFILFTIITLFSCSKKKGIPEGFEEGDTYFSTIQYLEDYWNNNGNQPFMSVKLVEKEKRVYDTQFVELTRTNFDIMTNDLVKGDIGDPKFLGEYTFSVLDQNGITTLLYEANNEDLFTRKLIINMDPENNRILNVYVETIDDGFFKKVKTNTTFIPGDIVQIIKESFPLFGKDVRSFESYKLP